MKNPAKVQEQPISSTPQACLVAFHDAIYAQAELEAKSSMFEMVGPLAMRDDHDAIISTAQANLRAAGYSEAEQVAVSLLMLLEVKQLSFDYLTNGFGKDIANLVETSRAIGESGNVDDWHASLEKFARMPPIARRSAWRCCWALSSEASSRVLPTSPGTKKPLRYQMRTRACASGSSPG